MENPDQNLLAGMGVLSAIVDSGSFGAAAEVLGMSQSGVSRAVARLETGSASGCSTARPPPSH